MDGQSPLIHVLTHEVAPESPQRLDSYLRFTLGISRRAVRVMKACGGMMVNGGIAEARRLVAAGDRISLWLPREDSGGVVPESLPMRVVYEDEHVLVVDKPPGMVTHPVKRHQSGTLANAVSFYLAARGGAAASHPVNRLDKDTSGLVVFAKNAIVHEQLAGQMQLGTFGRTYVGLAEGNLDQSEGCIDLPIADPDPGSPRRQISENGRPARTRYSVVACFGASWTLLKLRLESGRTHQIRVHLSAIGHPLMGDAVYGHDGNERACPIARQALHATELHFIRPFSDTPVLLISPIPPDFVDAIAECAGMTFPG